MNTFMQKLGVLAAMLSTFLSVFAYDFEADGIYYNITNPTAKEVEVTSGDYSGDIVVPPSVSYDGDLYSVTTIGDKAFFGCDNLTTITIPNSVTSIRLWAFRGCSNLSSITLPGSLTTIEYQAFFDCSNLTSITIPNNSLISIGDQAFRDCRNLTSITLPNSVTDIGMEAFSGCRSLTLIDVDVDNQTYSSNDGILYDKSQTNLICCPEGKSGEVIIPNSVTSIWIFAFSDCSSLTSITIPNSVTEIGDMAFSYCSSLTSITLPNSVTSIEGWAFSHCSSLTSITLPNSVTAIEDYAFFDCSNLTSITLPNSVTTIGVCAFSHCSSLTSITSHAVTPPECGDAVFYEVDKQKSTLYVPAESVEAYKQAFGWKDFVLVEAVEAGIDSVAADSADGATEVFNLTGAKVADTLENLPAGIYLVRKGSTIRKIAVR